MKKVLLFLVTVLLCAGLCVTAFAAGPYTKSSVTVSGGRLDQDIVMSFKLSTWFGSSSDKPQWFYRSTGDFNLWINIIRSNNTFTLETRVYADANRKNLIKQQKAALTGYTRTDKITVTLHADLKSVTATKSDGSGAVKIPISVTAPKGTINFTLYDPNDAITLTKKTPPTTAPATTAPPEATNATAEGSAYNPSTVIKGTAPSDSAAPTVAAVSTTALATGVSRNANGQVVITTANKESTVVPGDVKTTQTDVSSAGAAADADEPIAIGSKNFTAGIIIGIIAGLVLGLILFWFFTLHKNAQDEEEDAEEETPPVEEAKPEPQGIAPVAAGGVFTAAAAAPAAAAVPSADAVIALAALKGSSEDRKRMEAEGVTVAPTNYEEVQGGGTPRFAEQKPGPYIVWNGKLWVNPSFYPRFLDARRWTAQLLEQCFKLERKGSKSEIITGIEGAPVEVVEGGYILQAQGTITLE
ncbi:MAG: hypothetical protein LBR73_04725 [Oscillospiraceae bacterium]|nr:hypothetical protein [Oscillospiraceae bacterium]